MTHIGWIIPSPVSFTILTLHLKLMNMIDNTNTLQTFLTPQRSAAAWTTFPGLTVLEVPGQKATTKWTQGTILIVDFETNLSSFREKMRTKYHFHRPGVDAFNMAKLGSKDKVGRRSFFLKLIHIHRGLGWGTEGSASQQRSEEPAEEDAHGPRGGL